MRLAVEVHKIFVTGRIERCARRVSSVLYFPDFTDQKNRIIAHSILLSSLRFVRVMREQNISFMLEWFTETTGKQRLIYGLVGVAACLVLLFVFKAIWFWLCAVTAVLLLSSVIGEWK